MEKLKILLITCLILLSALANAQGDIPVSRHQTDRTTPAGPSQGFGQGESVRSDAHDQDSASTPGNLQDFIVSEVAGGGQPATFRQGEAVSDGQLQESSDQPTGQKNSKIETATWEEVHKDCPSITAKSTKDLKVEIPTFQSYLQNCRAIIPSPINKLIGDGQVQINVYGDTRLSVWFDILDNVVADIKVLPYEYEPDIVDDSGPSVLDDLERFEAERISLGNRADYYLSTKEESLDQLLQSDDKIEMFQTLYKSGDIKLQGGTFVPKVKLFFIKIGFGVYDFITGLGTEEENQNNKLEKNSVIDDLEMTPDEQAVLSLIDEGNVIVNRKEPCPPEYLKKLQEKKADLENQVGELERKSYKLSREIMTLEQQLESLRQDKSDRQELIAETKKTVETTTNPELKTDAELSLEDLEQKQNKLNREISEKESELNSLEEELDLTDQQIRHLNANINKFNDIARHCGVEARKALENVRDKWNKLPPDTKDNAENDFEDSASSDEKKSKDGGLYDEVDGGGIMTSTTDKMLKSMRRASNCPPPKEKIVRVEDPTEKIVLMGVENISITDARGKNFFPDSKKKEIIEEITKGIDMTGNVDDASDYIDLFTDKNPFGIIYDIWESAAQDAILAKLEEWEKERILQGLPEWFEVSYGRLWEKEYRIKSAYNKVYVCENSIWQFSHNTLAIGDIEYENCRYFGGGKHEYQVELQKLDLRGCGGNPACPLAWQRAMEDAMRSAISGPLNGLIIGPCPV